MSLPIGAILTPLDAFQLAIKEAKRGAGRVSPNPLVGCAILDAQMRLLAVGFHRAVGLDHAEVDAIKKLASPELLKGAHFFVTLEPCAHEGRTGSCAKALAALPLASVTFGLMDPNPLTNGKGEAILKAAGISTRSVRACLDWPTDERESLIEELEELIEVFLWNQHKHQPFISLKVATSLDGQMAIQESGESKWITGDEARLFAHYLRAQHDAIMVGRNTVFQDDPQLNIRHPDFPGRVNKVIILDPEGKSLVALPNSSILNSRAAEHVIVILKKEMSSEERSELNIEPVRALGVHVREVSVDSEGHFDLSELWRTLWQEKIMSVMVEGGARSFGQLLDLEQVHRIHLFMAPLLIGGETGLGWTQYFGVSTLTQAPRLKRMLFKALGQDIYLTAQLKKIRKIEGDVPLRPNIHS